MRIVIGTNPDRLHWLSDCLASIPDEFLPDVDVITTRHFEVDAIRQGSLLPRRHDRFLFVQDSVVFKDVSYVLSEANKHSTALLIPRPSCYLAVYHRRVLDQMWWPHIQPDDKEESVRHETYWVDSYLDVAKRTFRMDSVPVIFPELTDRRAIDNNNIKPVHGERRLHLENQYMVKRKGLWR